MSFDIFHKMERDRETRENKINEEAEKYYTQYLDKFLKPGDSYELVITVSNVKGEYLVTINDKEDYISEKRAFDLVKLIREYKNNLD